MEQTYQFQCTKCDYNVESSGELDYGMLAVVRPFICKDCKEVVDVAVGECGRVYEKNTKQKTGIDDLYKCPKCSGWMKRNMGGPVMLWD